MNTDLILWGIIALFVTELVCVAYLREKGKNQATKEDIGKITTEIEKVKNNFAHLLNINSFRYQKEYEILTGLAVCLVRYRDIAMGYNDFALSRESRDTTVSLDNKQYYSTLKIAYSKFYLKTEKHRPFYPENIYKLLMDFDTNIKRMESCYKIASATQSDLEQVKRYNEADELRDKILPLSEMIIKAIRDRAQSWELDMPITNEEHSLKQSIFSKLMYWWKSKRQS